MQPEAVAETTVCTSKWDAETHPQSALKYAKKSPISKSYNRRRQPVYLVSKEQLFL